MYLLDMSGFVTYFSLSFLESILSIPYIFLLNIALFLNYGMTKPYSLQALLYMVLLYLSILLS